jgi:predicted ABC-type ATPase
MGNSVSKNIPRVRMFAGPNGSGKSTIKSVIGQELLGVYVNPDEIEDEMRKRDFIDFGYYQIQTVADEVLGFFKKSPLLEKVDLLDDAAMIRFGDDKLIFHDAGVNTYFASVAADFIRSKLLEVGRSFTFETVMSYSDKVEILRKAQSKGYRTYLYYIATEDPEINVSRVQYRISIGGHSVPKDKIVERYKRSLDLLVQAVQASNRAYIFDNSHQQPLLVAEITNGRLLEMKTDQMPGWFKKALGNKFFPS